MHTELGPSLNSLQFSDWMDTLEQDLLDQGMTPRGVDKAFFKDRRRGLFS